MRQRLTLCLLQLVQTHLYEGLASFVGLSWVFRGPPRVLLVARAAAANGNLARG